MTLRSRLLMGTLVVAALLLVAAVVVTATTERFLIDRVDEQLAAATPILRRASEPSLPPTGPPPGSEDNDPETTFSTFFIGSIDASGDLVVQATGLSDDDMAVPDIEPAEARGAARADRTQPFTVGSLGGSDTRYRVLAIEDPSGTSDEVAVAALPLTDVDAAIERLLVVEGVSTMLVVTILGIVTFWVIRLGVRPVRRMTEAASVIAEGDLSHRVPAAREGTEAGDLGSAFNVMLGRIEDAFARQEESEARLRRFVADASHELRTPVTTISGYTQLYRDGGLDDPDELANAMRRSGQEATRMAGLVDAMLLLARLDQGQPLERRPVDLATLARDAVADARAVEPDRPISIDETNHVVVEGDDDRLRQVVGNLVRNALVHTPHLTPVHVAVGSFAGTAMLVVSDEGPGMDDRAAAHAFERFYRADVGRSRDRGGAGLGLAIVRSIVEAHDGSVALETGPGQGTTVRVKLPLAAPAPSSVSKAPPPRADRTVSDSSHPANT